MDAAVYKLLEQMPVVNGFRKDSCIEVCRSPGPLLVHRYHLNLSWSTAVT